MLALIGTKRVQFFSIFSKASLAPPDSILGININFAKDQDPRKVNLGVGAYRNDNLQPVILSIVDKVQKELAYDSNLNKVFTMINSGIYSYRRNTYLCLE